MPDLESFIREARAIVGQDHVIADPIPLSKLAENTLAVDRSLSAAVYPESTAQVRALVLLAKNTGIPLYPVSRGRNMGYGDRAPAADGHVLLELSRMRQITFYDDKLGSVRIEAGVSQRDLYEFLRREGSRFWMDATGAGLDASIVGNTLEGGFGHTPLGNHREAFSDAEIVLAGIFDEDGLPLVFKTGRFPGLGPDLKGLFVQSNYGIVTSMRVPLMPAPEHFESFALRADRRDSLPQVVDTLRRLRMENVLSSCVHIANPVRYLVSSRRCPPEYRDRVVDDAAAKRIMSSRLLKVGYWNAAGGLYGLRRAVEAHKERMVKAFKGVADVQFFSDAKLARIEGLAGRLGRLGIPLFSRIHESLVSFGHIHRMMQGVPSDEAYRNILWRVDSQEKLGLIWFAPTQDAKGQEAARTVSLAAPLFERHGFDMPVTITLVASDRMVAVFNIVFDKTDPREKERAWRLYSELREKFQASGIGTYRSSIMNMGALSLDDHHRGEVLNHIKAALDPDGVISRGRYGIASSGRGA